MAAPYLSLSWNQFIQTTTYSPFSLISTLMLSSEALVQVRGPQPHFVIRSLSFVNICHPHPPAHKLEYHPLSAVCQNLFNIPAATLHTRRPPPPFTTYFVTPNNSQTRLSEKDGSCTDPVIYFHLLLYRTSDYRHLRKMSDPSIFISCRRSGEQPLNNG